MSSATIDFSWKAICGMLLRIYGVIILGGALLRAIRVDFDVAYLGYILIPSVWSIALPALIILFVIYANGKQVTITDNEIIFVSWFNATSKLSLNQITSHKQTKHALILTRHQQANKVIGRYCYDSKPWGVFYAKFLKSYESKSEEHDSLK